MTDELLPCPFCGGEAEELIQSSRPTIRCKNSTKPVAGCGVRPEVWAFERGEAIKHWNARAEACHRGEYCDMTVAYMAGQASNRPEWRGIKTAPKATKAIMVFCADRVNTYIVTWGQSDFYEDRRECWKHFGGHRDLDEVPTHWRPLPANPKHNPKGE